MKSRQILSVVLLASVVSLSTTAGAQSYADKNTGQKQQSMRQGDQGRDDNDDRPRRPRGPPPEAVAACNGKTQGAACNFTDRENEKLSGSCFAPPPREAGSGDGQSMPIACRPDRGGPPRQHG